MRTPPACWVTGLRSRYVLPLPRGSIKAHRYRIVLADFAEPAFHALRLIGYEDASAPGAGAGLVTCDTIRNRLLYL